MTKKKYQSLTRGDDEGRKEMCDLILALLNEQRNREVSLYHSLWPHTLGDEVLQEKALGHYWSALAFDRAAEFVEDMK